MEYTGDSVTVQERAEKNLERKTARLQQSEFVRSLREEFTDVPAEVRDEQQSANAKRTARKLDERQNYEEEHMVRLRPTKTENKMQRAYLRQARTGASGAVSLDNITADFHELSSVSGATGTSTSRLQHQRGRKIPTSF